MLALTGGGYEPIESSVGLPGLTTALIDAFVAHQFDRGETTLIKEFCTTIGGG